MQMPGRTPTTGQAEVMARLENSVNKLKNVTVIAEKDKSDGFEVVLGGMVVPTGVRYMGKP